MFKKKDDGTYRYSGRFWTYAIVASILIVFIGIKTQVAADRADEANTLARTQASQAAAFARQTNDCLAQVIVTLTDRSRLNAENERLAGIERQAIFTLLNKLTTIPVDAPQDRRIALTNQYISEAFEVTGSATQERTQNALQRARNVYPDPTCGLVEPPK